MKNIFREIFRGKVVRRAHHSLNHPERKRRIVIVGIGNTLRSDDGFGPVLIDKLQGKVKAVCLDAGSAPENYTGKIAKEDPDTILIVDAVHLGLAPGKYEILRKDEILKSGLSTHDISPKMLIEYLENQTKAEIYMLGVQPKSVSFGQGLSANVEKTLKEISQLIKEADNA